MGCLFFYGYLLPLWGFIFDHIIGFGLLIIFVIFIGYMAGFSNRKVEITDFNNSKPIWQWREGVVKSKRYQKVDDKYSVTILVDGEDRFFYTSKVLFYVLNTDDIIEYEAVYYDIKNAKIINNLNTNTTLRGNSTAIISEKFIDNENDQELYGFELTYSGKSSWKYYTNSKPLWRQLQKGFYIVYRTDGKYLVELYAHNKSTN